MRVPSDYQADWKIMIHKYDTYGCVNVSDLLVSLFIVSLDSSQHCALHTQMFPKFSSKNISGFWQGESDTVSCPKADPQIGQAKCYD